MGKLADNPQSPWTIGSNKYGNRILDVDKIFVVSVDQADPSLLVSFPEEHILTGEKAYHLLGVFPQALHGHLRQPHGVSTRVAGAHGQDNPVRR